MDRMRSAEISKWQGTISTALLRELSYSADFFLTLFVPSAVFVAINYNVWRAIYSLNNLQEIDGLNLQHMLAYQGWAFVATLLVRASTCWRIAEDIRMGKVSAFLLYPFEYWKYHACEFLGNQTIHCAVVALVIVALHALEIIPSFQPSQIVAGIALCLLASCLWFVLQFLIGIISFWLEESYEIGRIFDLTAFFLSGAIIPLELFPAYARTLIHYTPFPLLTSMPVNVFLGTYSGGTLHAFCVLCLWISLLTLVARFTWVRGIKRYTGSGM